MPNEWRHCAEIRPEAGEFQAYSDDLPEAIAAGLTEADALREMGRGSSTRCVAG